MCLISGCQLLHWSVLTPVIPHLDYCSFIRSVEATQCKPSIFFLFQSCFNCLGPLHYLPYEFFFFLVLVFPHTLYFFHFVYYYLAPLYGMWGLSSQAGIRNLPLQWKHSVLTTGPPGKSSHMSFKISSSISTEESLLGFWLG